MSGASVAIFPFDFPQTIHYLDLPVKRRESLNDDVGSTLDRLLISITRNKKRRRHTKNQVLPVEKAGKNETHLVARSSVRAGLVAI